MMLRAFVLLLALSLGFGATGSVATETSEAYDLVFRNGTLDSVPEGQSLVYRRAIENTLKPEVAERDSGDIVLSLKMQDETEMAYLRLRQGDRSRGLGRFPSSVGNPMIMFFYESVIRDMAESAGGSPFYIRNRVKDALVQPVDVETSAVEIDGKTVPVQVVRFFPFAEDPNRDRMQGFADLELRMVMSDQVPGWYLTLTADAGDSYHSELRFETMETAE